MPTIRLSEQGQVLIPAKIRSQLGLQCGDRFEVEVGKGGVIFKLMPRNPLVDLRGAFKGPGSLTEALLHEREAEE